MCGRFTITVSEEVLAEFVIDRYGITESKADFIVPNYNVSPGTRIVSVINDGDNYRIGLLKWGYLPPFPIKNKTGFINARAETIFTKPSFRHAASKQRCIVLADGYYEWNKDKRPIRIMTDLKLFSMAGLWNTYIDDEGKKHHTVAIVTINANDATSQIHDRMPVIFTRESEKIWLNPYEKEENLKRVLNPYQGKMEIYPVSKEVNFTKNNYSSLIKRVI